MGGKTQNMSVDELRAQISQRLRSSAAFSKTVYQEQPIIMTGSQLKSFTSDPIREARQLARNAYSQSKDVASVFYEQARLLAGYEDDFEYTGTFSQYYPTYEDMSNEQLRGYFAWRTQVRKGNIMQGSLSFAYVYLYELINLIGVASAQEGYEVLVAFGTAYKKFDKRFEHLFESWLNDFVIYYDLDSSLLKGFAHLENDAAFDVLLNRGAHSQKELFAALCQLSDYAIRQSPFYPDHEGELEQLVAHAYEVAASHHDQKLSTTLASKLSGKLSKKRIWLFERAVFANPLDVQSATYAISPHDTVLCRTGAWFRIRYASLEGALPWVSQLLETCEYALREAYQYPNTLSQSIKTKYLTKAIDAQAKAIVEERHAREARAVHIDFGKLDHIRSAADETCEKLIVEEEEAAPVFASLAMTDEGTSGGGVRSEGLRERAVKTAPAGCRGATVEAERSSANAAGHKEATVEVGHDEDAARGEDNGVNLPEAHSEDAACSCLEPQEAALLAHLLQGGNAREFGRAHACIASVLVDSINEKLYDEFADICIDAATEDPVVLEDYTEDLRTMLGMN